MTPQNKLPNHIIKEIAFPNGKVKLLDGYSGSFQLEFYSEPDSFLTPQEEPTNPKIYEEAIKQWDKLAGVDHIVQVDEMVEKGGWEEEFEKLFKKLGLHLGYARGVNEKLKKFIHSLLSSEYDRGAREGVERFIKETDRNRIIGISSPIVG